MARQRKLNRIFPCMENPIMENLTDRTVEARKMNLTYGQLQAKKTLESMKRTHHDIPIDYHKAGEKYD